jgi:hypothetical protein
VSSCHFCLTRKCIKLYPPSSTSLTVVINLASNTLPKPAAAFFPTACIEAVSGLITSKSCKASPRIVQPPWFQTDGRYAMAWDSGGILHLWDVLSNRYYLHEFNYTSKLPFDPSDHNILFPFIQFPLILCTSLLMIPNAPWNIVRALSTSSGYWLSGVFLWDLAGIEKVEIPSSRHPVERRPQGDLESSWYSLTSIQRKGIKFASLSTEVEMRKWNLGEW